MFEEALVMIEGVLYGIRGAREGMMQTLEPIKHILNPKTRELRKLIEKLTIKIEALEEFAERMRLQEKLFKEPKTEVKSK